MKSKEEKKRKQMAAREEAIPKPKKREEKIARKICPFQSVYNLMFFNQ